MRHRTIARATVALGAAAGLALTAGVGLAQAQSLPGFFHGTVSWYRNGDTVVIKDTKADGWAFGVWVSEDNDPDPDHIRKCITSGVGREKACSFDFREGVPVRIRAYGHKKNGESTPVVWGAYTVKA
ncbi:hypothetical protein [Streptomyces nigrescens]|nr:hypothetical protein [Streptomyces nigrescens]